MLGDQPVKHLPGRLKGLRIPGKDKRGFPLEIVFVHRRVNRYQACDRQGELFSLRKLAFESDSDFTGVARTTTTSD